MKIDRELDEILGELRREHRATNAPESIETALRAKTRRQRRESGAGGLLPALRPVPRPVLAWAFAIALVAAIVWGGTVLQMRRIHGQGNSAARPAAGAASTISSSAGSSPTAPTRRDTPPLPLPVESAGKVHSAPAEVQRAGINRVRPHAASVPQDTASVQLGAANSLVEFVRLPVSEGLPPAAQLSVVRVKLHGSDLQQYGLEAPADAAMRNLLAEFVVGEDGLPRAIRIVK